MANGRQRGGLGGLPFPTFNTGGGKGGVIPQLNLRPAPINFPRAGGGGSRGRNVNPAAYLAPGIISLLGDKFLPKGETIAPSYILDDPKTDKDESATAYAQDYNRILKEAETRYGPDQAAPGFLGQLLRTGVDLAAVSAFGDEGGLEYAKTRTAQRAADKDARATLAAQKRQFIKDKTEKEFGRLMMVDREAAKYGMEDMRAARFDPDRGVYQLADPTNDKAGPDGYIDAPENFIPWDPTAARSAVDTLGDKDYIALQKAGSEIVERDLATDSTLDAINNAVDGLNRGNSPLTTVSALGSIGNSVLANVKQLSSVDGTLGGAFATAEQIAQGTAGSTGREGTGQYSKILAEALQSGDKDQIEAALKLWESAYADETLADGRSMSISKFLGGISYDKLDVDSSMIQIGYLLAAANGQTGRTLSDKDLMFSLLQIGYGATQDSGTATKLMLRVGNDLINRVDRAAQIKINPMMMQGYGASLNDPRYQAILGRYWNPATEGEGESFKEIWDKPENYSFRYFGDRTSYVKNFNGTNPFQTFNENVLKYNPTLRTTGATGFERGATGSSSGSVVTDTEELYN